MSCRSWKAQTALILVTLVMVSACTDTQTGAGSATSPPATTPSSSSSAQTSTPPGDVFANLKACDVLNKAIQGQGFAAGVLNKIGGDNGCQADKHLFGSIALSLQPDQGIDQINGGQGTRYSAKVNGRQAIETKEGNGVAGDCDMAIEVTKTSRALAIASLDTTAEACAFVEDIAAKIEPQLPKGN